MIKHLESYLKIDSLEQSGDGVSNDGGSEMTDVHLLGDVGWGEVHEHATLRDFRKLDSLK